MLSPWREAKCPKMPTTEAILGTHFHQGCQEILGKSLQRESEKSFHYHHQLPLQPLRVHRSP